MNQKYFLPPVLFIILILTAVVLGQLSSKSLPQATAQDVILDDECVASYYQVTPPLGDFVFEFKPAGTECHSNADVHGLCDGAGICVPGSELEKECNYITDRQICDPPVYGSGEPAEVYVCGSDNKWHLVRQCPTSECDYPNNDCSWPQQDCVIQSVTCPEEVCYPGETIDIKIGFSNWSYQKKPYTSRFIKALVYNWSQVWCDADKSVSSADNTETITIECDKLAGLRSANPNIKTGCSASSITGITCEVGFVPDNEQGCQVSYSAIPEKPALKHENKLPQSIFWQWVHTRGKVTEYRFYEKDGNLLKTLTPAAVCQSLNVGSACSWEESGFGLDAPANSPITRILSACNINGCSLHGYSLDNKQPYQETVYWPIEPVSQAVCSQIDKTAITVKAGSDSGSFSNLTQGSSGILFRGAGTNVWQASDSYTFNNLEPNTQYTFAIGPSRNGSGETNGQSVNVQCTTKSLDCQDCGQGLFNTCDKDECIGLGSCIFKADLGSSYGSCRNIIPVLVKVLDFTDNSAIANIQVKAEGFHQTNYSTDQNGSCSLLLAAGESYTISTNDASYLCNHSECPQKITPSEQNAQLTLRPKKLRQCVDSDATGEFPNGRDNFYTKGVATDLNGYHEDYCVSQTNLIEYYCPVPPDYHQILTAYEQLQYCERGCFEDTCIGPEGNPELKTQVFFEVIFQYYQLPIKALANATITVINKDNKAFVGSCITDYRGRCDLELASGRDYLASMALSSYTCDNPECPKEFRPIGTSSITIQLLSLLDPQACSYGTCPDTEKQEVVFKVFEKSDTGEKTGIPNALVEIFFENNQKAGECRTTKESPMFCSVKLCPLCMYYASPSAPGYTYVRDAKPRFMTNSYLNSVPLLMIKEGQVILTQVKCPNPDTYWCANYEAWQKACQGEGDFVELEPNTYCLDKNSQKQNFCAACSTTFQDTSQCEQAGGYCERQEILCRNEYEDSGLLGCQYRLRRPAHCCLNCAKFGENIDTTVATGKQKQCCPGLLKVDINGTSAACVSCGDDACQAPENNDNCPQDCLEPSVCEECGQGIFNVCDEQECLNLGDCVFIKSTLNLNNQCISRDFFERANMSVFLRRIDDLRLSIVKIKAQINTASKNQLETFLSELDDLENGKIIQLQEDIADSKLNQAMKADLNQRIEKLKIELKDARAQINKALQANIGSDMISAKEGGIIETTVNGKVVAKLIIPPQALYTDAKATIDLIPISQMPTRAALQTSPSGEFLIGADRLVMGNYFFAFLVEVSTGEAIRAFAKPITIIFQYLDSQLSGLGENSLTVYYFEESIAKWVGLPTTVDLEKNTLTVQVKHLTVFGIAAAKAEDGAVPVDGQADDGKKDVWILNPLKISTIQQLINVILNWLLIIVIPLATIIIIWSALLFMTSGGEPKRVTRARRTLIFAVVGIIILLLAKGMSYTIANFLSL